MSEGTPTKQLPRWVDPRKFAQQCVNLAGIVPEEDLQRLQDASYKRAPSQIDADLQFFSDEEGRRCLGGKLTATLLLECQRCLEPYELTIATEVHLAVVWDEIQAQALPKTLDPWIVGEEGDLHSVLEEELLLALPAIALHGYECVDASVFSVGDEAEVSQASAERKNPFGVLASLMPDKQKSD